MTKGRGTVTKGRGSVTKGRGTVTKGRGTVTKGRVTVTKGRGIVTKGRGFGRTSSSMRWGRGAGGVGQSPCHCFAPEPSRGSETTLNSTIPEQYQYLNNAFTHMFLVMNASSLLCFCFVLLPVVDRGRYGIYSYDDDDADDDDKYIHILINTKESQTNHFFASWHHTKF